VNTIEMYWQHFKKRNDLIDIVITPSNFHREKFIEFGFSPDKIIHIPNFLDTEGISPSSGNQDYFIFLGRLSEEKGIMTLLTAMHNINRAKLLIVGNGPMQQDIEVYIHEKKLQNKAFLVGHQVGKELEELIRGAIFGVIPSECYENAPYSVLEMMAYGKPVIGSNIGGIPEIIEDRKTGLIFEKGNPIDLAQKIDLLLNNRDLIIEYGRCARENLEKKYNAEKHYKEIFNVYNRLVTIQQSVPAV